MRTRKNNRLPQCDYSQAGYYFVTVCTHNKQCWFGEIVDGEMCLNDFGKIVAKCWCDLPDHYKNVQLDEFVVMPNHIHGILIIHNELVGNRHACSLQKFVKRQHEIVPCVLGSYKSAVSKYIHDIPMGSCFRWQKSFYDHVIRSERTLENIRAYIQNNPLRWDRDWENKPPSFQDKAGLKKYYDDILNGV